MTATASTLLPAGAAGQRMLTAFGFYTLGAGLLMSAYVLTFVQGGLTLVDAAGSALCNVGTAYVLGLVACGIVLRVMSAPWPLQFTIHTVAAGAYAWSWYGLMRFTYAAADWIATGDFRMTSFSGPVLTWQLCQGLLVYALLACATYAFRLSIMVDASEARVSAEPAVREEFRRFLTRKGDRIEPVNVDEIISISGADDYSEVVTSGGRHLVRLPLGEFERRLGSGRFLRVHRSRIINFDRLVSAEPAGGGRMLLHLEGGEAIQVSRTGAQRIRERLV